MDQPPSDEIINATMSSDCDSTNALYNRNFSKFAEWFNGEKESKTDFNMRTIAEFILALKAEGKAFSTVNNYKTALQPVVQLVLDVSVHSDYTINTIIKKMKKLQRHKVPEIPQWDVNTVLDFLASETFAEDASESRIFQKATFLLLLASSRRPSDIAGLSLRASSQPDCGRVAPTMFLFHPEFTPKNRSLHSVTEPVQISCIEPHDNNLCPIAAVVRYLRATAARRDRGLSYLFMPVEGRAGKCTPSYISKTTKRLIIEAHRRFDPGRDVRGAQAKQVRRLASSLAFHAGKRLEDVMRAAGWSSATAFVRHYLIRQPLHLRRSAVIGGSTISE